MTCTVSITAGLSIVLRVICLDEVRATVYVHLRSNLKFVSHLRTVNLCIRHIEHEQRAKGHASPSRPDYASQMISR